MKILAVSELWPPASGSFVFEQIKAVAPFVSVTVAVLVPHAPNLPRYRAQRSPHANKSFGPCCMPELGEGVEVYYLHYRTIPELSKYVNSLQARSVLRRFLIQQKGRFDLIHAHFAYIAGFAAVSAGKRFGLPVIITAHGSDINVYTRRHPRTVVAARMTIWGLRHAAAVTVVSEDLKNKVSGLGVPDRNITVIPNGIRETFFYPRGKKFDLRRQLQLPQTGVCFLFVGNLVQVKGLEFLLNAFARFLEQESSTRVAPATLVMIGSGVLEMALKRQAEQLTIGRQIIWAGQRPYAEMPFWMSAAEFLLLPSLSEGYGLVILEALACGTPAIASRVGGVQEILTSPELGILVPPADSEALALAMRAALNKTWNVQNLVAYAHTHTWAERARCFLQLYHRLVPSKTASN